jgi:hypothetical protein
MRPSGGSVQSAHRFGGVTCHSEDITRMRTSSIVWASMSEVTAPMFRDDGRTFTAAFLVLAKWYAAHPAVRRLWAIKESQGMRVIITLEPTHDGDDIYPVWLANGHAWAHELQLLMDGPVQLEAMDEPLLAEVATGVDGVLVAELFWRH